MHRALIPIATIVSLIMLAAPARAAGPEPTCLGRTPADWRAAGYTVIVGTAANNTIQGTWRNDAIFGLGGDDTIYGNNGDDVLCGGPGDDVLNGGSGINVLVGGAGADLLSGGPKRDEMIGDEVVDRGAAAVPPDEPRPGGWLEGTGRPDPRGEDIYLFGHRFTCDDAGAGNDQMFEAAGGGGEEASVAPRLYGCAGDDWLDGGDGDEYLHGGAGDDTLIGGPGNDWAACGDGTDWFDGGYNQGAVSADGLWAAVDSDYAGDCETVVNVP